MHHKQDPFIDVARRAVEEYGLKGYTLRFIRHSDTVTFKVVGADLGAHLLRIHVPISGAMGTHGRDTVAVNSELLWLEALSQDTDLVLQRPVRNRQGALVTQVPVGDSAVQVNCTLLDWVKGQPYHRELETEHTACQIGQIVSTLHIHASQWEIPAGFRRPRRDTAYFEGALRGIRPALRDGRLSRSDDDKLEALVAILVESLRSLDENRQTYGLMHADAHKGNLLYHHGSIRVIDFSFCAFGNFMFDLGICLSDMEQKLHGAFLRGYRGLRTLPEGHERLIEGLFLGSMVGTFSYWVSNPRAQNVLVAKAPEIARKFAAKFNRGERFWFA